MKNVIQSLANGAVKAQLRDGITDPVAVQHEATLEALAGFVRVMERQPSWQEVEQVNKAIQRSIAWNTTPAEDSEVGV